ncbi:hypothetical protein [Streptomyces sp. 135]|uniref:hypothetical protein n=1 Tax=Streptomyces sp. 135 TaxID=2838850 RepID=UPI001CBBB87A|nr:hypothetical protein [Streptomyces sp. 135]
MPHDPAEIEQAAAEDVRRADATLVDLQERGLADDQDVAPAEIEAARLHLGGRRRPLVAQEEMPGAARVREPYPPIDPRAWP